MYWTQGFRRSQALSATARHPKSCKYIRKSILDLPTALSGTWSGRSQCQRCLSAKLQDMVQGRVGYNLGYEHSSYPSLYPRSTLYPSS